MALQDISLPYDVVWTLIATSDDMLATHDNRFPHAMWRNSLAVFKFDPNPADLPDAAEYQNRAITFLKVVASITSYAPECLECPPVQHTTAEDYGNYQAEDAAWAAKCEEVLHQSYPCAGALIQVAVYPKDKEQQTSDPNDLAYFAAFEPKKRELIEVATESGESVTQSQSAVKVNKGVTSTHSTEDLDVFTGANLSVGAGGASAGVGITGQWGTIKKSGTQQQDVTNTDSSRDLRETASHTTSLSQLYHLLNSYHLGTNRAIFFVQPRPHTLQQKDQFTFINGPQEIEGIQEFFLVVSRPINKKLEDYCVDALLYTGHLDIVAMQNAINEPKTAETEWIDLWAVKEPLPGGDSVWNLDYWVDKADELTDEVKTALEKAIGLDTNGKLPAGVKLADPAVLDLYITPSALNTANGGPTSATLATLLTPPGPSENGWRVDRTRGLGGYDLWEDPNNMSGDFRGKFDEQITAKPQGYVDVISLGSPDDLTTYQPDYALRIRAKAWPWAENQATYHCRVKGYFLRNDLPTLQRQVNMFVTARGVSTCSDSPFNDLAPSGVVTIGPAGPADILADAVVRPPNIAPWTPQAPPSKSATLAKPVTPEGSNDGKRAWSPEPILYAPPSGLNHPAIGAARVKMANAVSSLVRSQLTSALACIPRKKKPTRYRFNQSDLYFQSMARMQLGREIGQLARRKEHILGLNKAVIMHPATRAVVGGRSPALQAIRGAFRSAPAAERTTKGKRSATGRTEEPKEQARASLDNTKVEVKPTARFPLLTLDTSRLDESLRNRFEKVGILTGLDLINVPASTIARRCRIDVNELRNVRLRLLGFELDEGKDQDG